MEKRFKILSIDGGGIRGVFPAQYLASMEQRLKEEGYSGKICDHFDLICGTSTGGIIALGLSLGISASELRDLYLENRKAIFKWPGNKLFRRKYSRKKLEKLIIEKFNSASETGFEPRMLDAKTRLCITAYDIENAAPKVYKTGHLEEYKVDIDRPMYQVALSTGAAPTYFSPFSGGFKTIVGEESVNVPLNVDGGVFANNPTLIGIIEANCKIGIDLDKIEVLSIGTGTELFSESNTKSFLGMHIPRAWGPFYWMNKTRILSLLFQAQSQHIHDVSKVLSKGGNQPFPYFRVQTRLDSSLKVSMDSRDQKKLNGLVNRATHEFQKNGNEVINLLIKTPKWGEYNDLKKQ